MLLQTNSYIVPKEKRTEHTRLMRRFRQMMLRLGCDHFEVYEQAGANWSNAESTARYVQILRFVDRKHQLAVQAAERTDSSAQAVISDFCDLINFQYQQDQGLFAVGFYNAVLPTLPKRGARGEVVSTVEQEVTDEPEAEMSDAMLTEETVATEAELTDELHEPSEAPSSSEPEIPETTAHEPVLLETSFEEPLLEELAQEPPVHDTSFAPEEELAQVVETPAAEPAIFSGQHMKLVRDEDEPFDAEPLKLYPPHPTTDPEAKLETDANFRSEARLDPGPEYRDELQAEPQTEPQPELQATPEEELEMLEPEDEEEFSLSSHEMTDDEKNETGHDSFAGAVAEAGELRDVDQPAGKPSAFHAFSPLEEETEPTVDFKTADKPGDPERSAGASEALDTEEEYFLPDEPVEPIRAYAPVAPKPPAENDSELLDEVELLEESEPHMPAFPRHENDTMTLADGEITEELEDRAHGFIASELDDKADRPHPYQIEKGDANAEHPHQAVPKHDPGHDSHW